MSRFDTPVTYDNFAVSRDDDIVTVRMDSTSTMNGFSPEFLEEFREITMGLREDDSVRAVVLTGSKDAYSVGADIAPFDGDERDGRRLRYLASTLHEVVRELLQLRAPLITAVNGVAAGAGFSLALLGDVVLVSDEASLRFAYPAIGLTGDGASTFLLPRLVGLRKAREIVLMDEPIAPTEAVSLELATEMVPDSELAAHADDVAAELAAGPTVAYGETKRLLLESFDRSLEEQLAAETNAMARATKTADYRRGYEAFFGDEEATFEGQ
jgi:2-(1,2-epoxy-1,2-dihydrophenyl)acetyl-CoA isomerase